MDEDKIADLAKSFSVFCKQALRDNQLSQKITSPAVTLIALTVWRAVVDGGTGDKVGGWW